MQAVAAKGAGDVLSAVGGLAAGSAYMAQGKFNQRIAERNALNTENDAAAEAERVRYDMRQQLGQQLVAQGASGLEMGTGSAVDALKESQTNAALDVLTLRRKGATDAASIRMQGQLAKMEAKGRAIQSYFGAAKSLTDAASRKY